LDLLAGKLSSSGRFVKFVSAPSDQIFDDVASDLKSYRVDAVIATLGIESAEAVQALDDMKVPVVRFASGPSGTFIRTVTTDNYSVGWQAAELMVEGGRQSFAFIAGTGSSSQDLRATGFETRLKQTGLPYRRIIAPGHDYQAGRASVQSLLSQCPVDGLMCGNDNVACGVIDELRLKGFDLPGDMSVVGCDDIEQASWSAFKLTSFRQRLDLMTDKAIALLEGPLPEEHEFLFAPELVRRASG
jgi:DNA-binding LacI/PurR family transcriptional regulator